MNRICIGIPSPEEVHYRHVECFYAMLSESQRTNQISHTRAVSSVISKNRCNIVDAAKAWGATHVCMIDSDQTFPTNSLNRLLAHDKDIVCATTSKREEGKQLPVCDPLDLKSYTPGQILVPMRLVGFPFMLIKMSVFDKLRKPYFADPPRWMMLDEPKAEDVMMEDEYFCMTARAAGFDIFCDMQLSMEIGHIGTKEYYIKNARK